MSYVTFDASKDILGVFGDILTGDKDYKVIQYMGEGVQIIGDQGQTVVINKLFFYEDTLPESVYDGFENLKYVEPEDYLWDTEFSNYITLIVSDLSKEQLSYMNAVLDTNGQYYNGEDYLTMDIDDRKWFWDDGDIDGDSVIYFNDLFKEI